MSDFFVTSSLAHLKKFCKLGPTPGTPDAALRCMGSVKVDFQLAFKIRKCCLIAR